MAADPPPNVEIVFDEYWDDDVPYRPAVRKAATAEAIKEHAAMVRALVRASVSKGVDEFGLLPPDMFADMVALRKALAGNNKEPKPGDKDRFNKCSWVQVTVNPPPGTTYEQFKFCVDKYVKRSICANHLYVYEIRSSDPDAEDPGLHVHILIDRRDVRHPDRPFRGRGRYEYTEYAKQDFGLLFPSGVGKWIDIKGIENGTAHQTARYYAGLKKDESKMAAVARTFEWREEHGILPIYPSVDALLDRFPDALQDDEVKELLAIEAETQKARNSEL